MRIFNPGEIIFNTFEVIELLNSGGMGNVYKVRHLKIPFVFALKQLKLPFKESKDIMIQSFISEISILRSLKHPNISKFYDSFYSNGNFFYVMEFIEGKDIKSFFNDLNDISEERILKYFYMCLNAVEYLHSRNIIHRDIKPSNIMIDFIQDVVKIIDFGIANFLGGNVTFVSPGYSPPEQYQNLPYKPYNDIFSLGITFLEIISGVKPKEQNFYFNNILHNEFIVIVKDLARKKISQRFLDILLRCVETNPENRFQTVNEIILELTRNNFKIDNLYLANFSEYV
ncbi:MAG: serine/threonine-protein kinase, partial [bacterium]